MKEDNCKESFVYCDDGGGNQLTCEWDYSNSVWGCDSSSDDCVFPTLAPTSPTNACYRYIVFNYQCIYVYLYALFAFLFYSNLHQCQRAIQHHLQPTGQPLRQPTYVIFFF